MEEGLDETLAGARVEEGLDEVFARTGDGSRSR
jgi:hypothetical protein